MGHEDSEVARVTRGARRRDDFYSGSCHRDFRPNPESVEARRSPQALGARLPGVDLDALVGDWLTVPDLCERLGLSPSGVRRLIEEREFVAVRRGERSVLSVPAAFVDEAGPLAALKGTITVLSDIGFDDPEIIEWLFTPDDSLPGGGSHAIDAIRAGFKTEVRRRAMEEG